MDAIIQVQCFCNGREVRNDDAYDVHAYDDLCHRGVLSFKQLKPIKFRYLLVKEVRQNFLFLRWIYDVYFSTHQY